MFLINENRSGIKNNKREKNQNQRIAERTEVRGINSDSDALQIRKKMLAGLRKARGSRSKGTKVLMSLASQKLWLFERV